MSYSKTFKRIKSSIWIYSKFVRSRGYRIARSTYLADGVFWHPSGTPEVMSDIFNQKCRPQRNEVIWKFSHHIREVRGWCLVWGQNSMVNLISNHRDFPQNQIIVCSLPQCDDVSSRWCHYIGACSSNKTGSGTKGAAGNGISPHQPADQHQAEAHQNGDPLSLTWNWKP